MKELYKPFISKSKNKKYSLYVVKNGKTKLIHFGDKRFKHYKDKLKNYSYLNHNDKNRLKRYYQRASAVSVVGGVDKICKIYTYIFRD